MVPYWDYDAPKNSTIPYQPRDTSAGALFASALVELSGYVPDSKERFLNAAKAIVEALSSPKYFIPTNKDDQLPALVGNGTVGPYPHNPYDVALEYGDYYLTQAVLRLSKL
jgi:unsaturated chondroitin disaccharide hydrolase